jgi:hypothetical protein
LFPPLKFYIRFNLSEAARLFEIDQTYKDSHIIILGVVRHFKSKIKTFTLIDSETEDYAFIDSTFAQKHFFPLHQLEYPRRFVGFDKQFTLSEIFIHITVINFALGNHVKRLPAFIIGLKGYPIILNHLWLRKHGAAPQFEHNTLTLASSHCLRYCTISPVKIPALTRKEKRAFGHINALTTLSTTPLPQFSVDSLPTTSVPVPNPLMESRQHIYKEKFSRIEKAIANGHPPKIKYRSFSIESPRFAVLNRLNAP